MKTEKENLGKILLFEKKTKRRASEGVDKGDFNFYTSSPIQTKKISKCDFNGEFLIFGTGGVASIHYHNGRFSISADCLVASTNDKVLTKYVYYYLKYHIYLIEDTFRGSGLKHTSKDRINNIEIIYPLNKEEQAKIVFIFEKIDSLIRKREEINFLRNKVLFNYFYSLFGNPAINDKGLKISFIKDLVKPEKNSLKAGPFGSSLKKEIYVKNGYKIYGQEQVIMGDINYGNYYISKEKFKEMEMFKIQEDDILISMVGTYGKVLLIPKEFQQGIINPRLVKISLDKNKILPIFFKYLFISEPMQELIAKYSHGGTMGIINLSILKKIPFINPDMALQEEFSLFEHKISDLKEKHQKSLLELNSLRESLIKINFN